MTLELLGRLLRGCEPRAENESPPGCSLRNWRRRLPAGVDGPFTVWSGLRLLRCLVGDVDRRRCVAVRAFVAPVVACRRRDVAVAGHP